MVMTDTVRPGPVVRLLAGARDVTFRNNLLVTDGSLLVMTDAAFPAGRVLWQGNDYYAISGRPTVRWAGTTYSGLAEWRSATGQEMTDGRKTGFEADPCFRGGKTPVVEKTGDAALLVPGCDTVAQKGLDLRSLFGTDTGGQDYFGEALGTTMPIGAALRERDGSGRADGPAAS